MNAFVVPPYDVWMKETRAAGRRRSKELKALDEAILAFHNGTGGAVSKRKAVGEALAAWKNSKGDWRSSVRNRSKIVEKLDAALGHVITVKILDAKEIRAFQELRRARIQLIQTMFQGKKMTVKGTAVTGTISSITATAKAVKQAADQARARPGPSSSSSSSGGMPRAALPGTPGMGVAGGGLPPMHGGVPRPVQDLLTSLFDTTDIAVVREALGSAFQEVVGAYANFAPGLGLVKSGGNMLNGWRKTAQMAWKRHNGAKTKEAFRPGDPAAAFDAVMRIMKREVNRLARDAGIDTAAFTVDAALLATGAGAALTPIKGAAQSAAKLTHTILLFARDYKEVRRANRLIADGALDFHLFEVSPILGAYVIAFAPTSSILDIAVADFGTLGWKYDAEALRRKAEPVVKQARDAVKRFRFTIDGLGFAPSGTKKQMAKDLAKAGKNVRGMMN